MQIPLPPTEMRRLVGRITDEAFDNPTGSLVFPELHRDQTRSVFDFGCGCGRLARMLIQQAPQPERYVGVDLHKGMVEWCQKNLTPHAPQFSFHHFNVFNAGLNPGSRWRRVPRTAEFPSIPPVAFVSAHSVFSHIVEEDCLHYLAQCAALLEEGGVFYATFFLFDKRFFPMMQAFQNALYINTTDPTNAVIYDRAWLLATIRSLGLELMAFRVPAMRGGQWSLFFGRSLDGVQPVELPEDTGVLGEMVPPLMPENAHTIGLD